MAAVIAGLADQQQHSLPSVRTSRQQTNRISYGIENGCASVAGRRTLQICLDQIGMVGEFARQVQLAVEKDDGGFVVEERPVSLPNSRFALRPVCTATTNEIGCASAASSRWMGCSTPS